MKVRIAWRNKTQCYFLSVIGWIEVLLLDNLLEGLGLGNCLIDWIVFLDYIGTWGDKKHPLFDFLGEEGKADLYF